MRRSATRTIDKSLDDVKNNVDFSVVKDAMASFQDLYVDKTIEIPLYYRKNVELANPRARQLLRQRHPQVGSTWNAEDWFATTP